MNRLSAAALVLTAWMTGTTIAPTALAQNTWPPFDDRYPPWGASPRTDRREPPSPRRDRRPEPYPVQPGPMSPLVAPVERSELPPVVASDGSGLPFHLWTGIDLQTAEQLMPGLGLPPSPPALLALRPRRLLTSRSPP